MVLFVNILHNQPAIDAFNIETIVPVIMARNAILEMSDDLAGTIAPNTPITVPIEAMFANPHNAYVEITMDLSCARERQDL